MYEHLDRRYALAVYQLGEEKGKVEEYISEIQQVVDVIKSNEEFQSIIKHPQINTVRKKEIFIKIFKGRLSEDILSYLLLLIDKDRILYLEEKLDEMKKIHLEKNNTIIAIVKSVIPLQDSQIEKLRDKLSKQYNKKIIIQTEIDTRILGGLYIRVGGDVIDGTLRIKLEEMKKIMIES